MILSQNKYNDVDLKIMILFSISKACQSLPILCGNKVIAQFWLKMLFLLPHIKKSSLAHCLINIQRVNGTRLRVLSAEKRRKDISQLECLKNDIQNLTTQCFQMRLLTAFSSWKNILQPKRLPKYDSFT